MFHGSLLLISILALGLGPLVVKVASRARAATVVLDAFVLVVVGGLVFLHVLPPSLATGGWWAVGAGVLGCVIPLLAERGMRPAGGTRGLTVTLALTGLGVHAMIDGLGLAGVEFGGHEALGAHGHDHVHAPGEVHDHSHDHAHGGGLAVAWAIIAHRVPVGIGIWWIVGRTLGRRIAVLTMLVVAVGTVLGWGLGARIVTDASEQAASIFQSLLAGSLLHVLLHAHVPPPAGVSQRTLNRWSVIGGLAAVGVVWAIESSHSHAVDGLSVGDVFWALVVESAPVLLLAYFAAGIAGAFMPGRWIDRLNRGSPVSQALRGIAIGLPLPVCSCGVVPIYRSLVARGTAIAAAVGFLIATPELEIAAIFITVELLGPEVAIARAIAAALLALLVGVTVAAYVRRKVASGALPAPGDATTDAVPIEDHSDAPFMTRLRSALRVGFVDMVDQTAPWILLGLGISAMLTPHLDAESFASLPAGLDVLLAAAIGMPLYVCASGSTPLAAVFIAVGLSPGAGLAFLLTGPATNVTTFGVLRQLHGRGAATVFAVSAFVGAVGLGYAVNAVLPSITPPLDLGHDHAAASPLTIAAVIGLGCLVLAALLRQGTRGFLESVFTTPHREHDHDRGADVEGGCCHE